MTDGRHVTDGTGPYTCGNLESRVLQFISQLLRTFCKVMGASSSLLSRYHPQSNETERVNQDPGAALRCVCRQHPSSCSSHLPWVACAHDFLVSSATVHVHLRRGQRVCWDDAVPCATIQNSSSKPVVVRPTQDCGASVQSRAEGPSFHKKLEGGRFHRKVGSTVHRSVKGGNDYCHNLVLLLSPAGYFFSLLQSPWSGPVSSLLSHTCWQSSSAGHLDAGHTGGSFCLLLVAIATTFSFLLCLFLPVVSLLLVFHFPAVSTILIFC